MQVAMHPNPTPAGPDYPPGVPVPSPLEIAFDAHHAVVFRTAYRITGNAHDAEDVLQTVFLRLAASGFDGIESIEAYLRRAAVNVSLNVLEQHARKNVPLENAPEPHAQTDQRELREVLRRAIATLGGRTAEMFALRFIEGNSNAEIAVMFGVSSLVVAVTLHRARKQLQKEITLLGGRK